VELIQVSRGLIESIAISAQPFLAHAGDIFARHPVRDVRRVGLHTWMSATRPGQYEGVLQPGRTDDRHWPLELFPEHAAGTSVFYADYDLLILDLSRRAAGYGRRMAGVPREPPPLPKRPASDWVSRPWWHKQCTADRGQPARCRHECGLGRLEPYRPESQASLIDRAAGSPNYGAFNVTKDSPAVRPWIRSPGPA
jgi:hypothetical protein